MKQRTIAGQTIGDLSERDGLIAFESPRKSTPARSLLVPKRHLIRLTSINEDALGEEIEILWELEPSAHVIVRAGLPCGNLVGLRR